jgi:hypothetical protein
MNDIIREIHYRLFNDLKLPELFAQREAKILEEINRYDREYILNINTKELVKTFESNFCIKFPILEDEKYVSREGETDIDINQDYEHAFRVMKKPQIKKGTFIEFAIPFEGDHFVFNIKPLDSRGRTRKIASSSKRLAKTPYGLVARDLHELRFIYKTIYPVADAIKRNLDHDISEIREYLELLKPDIYKFNDDIKLLVLSQIDARKDKLSKDIALIKEIGYPIKKYDGVEETYAVPLKRKVVTIEKPIPKTESDIPDPKLKLDDYDEILRIISNMAMVIERNPKAFQKLDEEDIRTFILMFLNGQYEGNATGETFNFDGKTDILIRADGRNIFIAECKFWRGQKGLTATIDQLLGYLSWRDTKTAIILFNHNRNLSEVIQKISETTKSHPNFKQQLENIDETTFRFIFAQRNDPNRCLFLTILIFDMPIE